MEFKEFLQKEEDELFDLGIDEVLGSALKFLGGAGGNLISQVGRGSGNLATGLGQTALGAGQGALSALQAAGGGLKRGKKTFDDAFSNIRSGAGKIGRGAAQLGGALTGVTPLLRGAQATAEPIGISGIYAPGSDNRTSVQDVFGLDSWEKQHKKPSISVKPADSSVPKEPDSVSKFLSDLEKEHKSKTTPQPPEFRMLVSKYRELKQQAGRGIDVEKNKQLMIRIREKLRTKYPDLYLQAIEAGKKKKKPNS